MAGVWQSQAGIVLIHSFIPRGNSTWRGGLMAPGDEWLCPGSVPVTRIPNPWESHSQLSQQLW